MYQDLDFRDETRNSVIWSLLPIGMTLLFGMLRGLRRECINGNIYQIPIRYCQQERFADPLRNNGDWNYTLDPFNAKHQRGFWCAPRAETAITLIDMVGVVLIAM